MKIHGDKSKVSLDPWELVMATVTRHDSIPLRRVGQSQVDTRHAQETAREGTSGCYPGN
jgi:hypothetical protein